jgi:hypothetical protein
MNDYRKQEWKDKVLFRSCNPGGDSPAISRAIYFFDGTMDFTPSVNATTKKGVLKIRSGFAPPQSKEINLSTAANIKAVTPAEWVAACSAAGFTGVTFSVETTGANAGRGKMVYTGAPSPATQTGINKYIEPLQYSLQVWGDLAANAGAGGSEFGKGKGCYFFADTQGDCKSLIPTENFADDLVIENDNGRGNKDTDTYKGRRGTLTVEYTTRLVSDLLRQICNGGEILAGAADTPSAYRAPRPNDMQSRIIDVHAYQMTTQRQSIVSGQGEGIREYLYFCGLGRYSLTEANGSWTDSVISMTFGNYIDNDGNDRNSPEERQYTMLQSTASHYLDIAVADWDAV